MSRKKSRDEEPKDLFDLLNEGTDEYNTSDLDYDAYENFIEKLREEE